MEQLEIKTYSRAEIGALLGFNPKDAKHFKRNVSSMLAKWGYDFKFNRNEIEIIKKPTTAEDRLKELFYRVYDLSALTDIEEITCFLYLLLTYEDFNTMPWQEREKEMKDIFNLDVSAQRMRRWYKQLTEKNLISKNKNDFAYWMTFYFDGKKTRKILFYNELPQDTKIIDYYYERRKEYLNNCETYTEAMKELWDETHLVIYKCYSTELNRIAEEAELLFSLIEEVIERKN